MPPAPAPGWRSAEDRVGVGPVTPGSTRPRWPPDRLQPDRGRANQPGFLSWGEDGWLQCAGFSGAEQVLLCGMELTIAGQQEPMPAEPG
ncbi:MAG: hypothetical protein DBW85_05050 [Synechococcus sp. MED-G71]|nr:MAG: hypothetical protein DBW85_05050 [Synechococcus sp. MED-G71]